MKAVFFSGEKYKDRFSEFLNTIESFGWEIYEEPNLSIDFSIVEIIFINFQHYDEVNLYKEKLLSFRGLIIFVCINDSSNFNYENIDEEILAKVSCWLTFQINEESFNKKPYYHENNKDKIILIPRFTYNHIYNIDDINYNDKINKIVFVGRSSGGYLFNGKNYRVEALKKIYNNSFLRNNFSGVLCDNEIIDSDIQNEEYNKTFVYNDINYFLTSQQWQEMLTKHTLNLGVMGHTKLGFRNIISLATKNVMVGTFEMTKDPYKWLFSEYFTDISYNVKEDFSDFEKVCEEALNSPEKTKEYALRGFDVYKTFYELTEANTYRESIWEIVEEKINNLGIYLRA